MENRGTQTGVRTKNQEKIIKQLCVKSLRFRVVYDSAIDRYWVTTGPLSRSSGFHHSLTVGRRGDLRVSLSSEESQVMLSDGKISGGPTTATTWKEHCHTHSPAGGWQ